MDTVAKPKSNSNLNLDQLERIRSRGDKIVAQCPLCAEEGCDKSKSNLEISEEGFVSCWRDPDHGFEVKKMIEGEWTPKNRREYVKPAAAKPKPIPKLTSAQIKKAFGYCSALASDADTAAKIGKARGWKPETVRGLALDADLGWTGRGIAFLYAHGCKLRWRRPDGKRGFRWEFGGNRELWRGAWIKLLNPKRVWITEGETDAITLIDRGFDNVEKGELVVALPGATTWRRGWGPLFRGRHAILVPDHDDAGSKGMEKAQADLVNFADKVSIYQWGAAE